MQSGLKDLRSFFIFVILALIWGSSFKLIKEGLTVFSGAQVGALRIALAGIAVTPLFIFVKKPTRAVDWMWLAVCGLLGNFFPAFLFGIGQEHMASSIAGAFNSLTPLFALLFGVFIFKNRANTRKFIGVIVGLSGSLLLIFSRNIDTRIYFEPFSAFLILVATAFYGINANLIKSKLSHVHPLSVGVIPVFIIGIPSIIISLLLDTPAKIAEPANREAFMNVLVLALLGTAFALILFNYFIQTTSALFASSVTYILPFVAAVWGWKDGEHISYIHLISLAIIILGVYLTRK